MEATLGGTQRVRLRKRSLHNMDIRVMGVITLERRNKADNALISRKSARNTIIDLPLFIDLIVDLSGAHLTQALARIRVTQTAGGGNIGFEQGGADTFGSVSSTNTNGDRRRFEFDDDSVTTRNAGDMQFASLYNGDPLNPTGDDAGGTPVEMTRVDVSSLTTGGKPASENWHWDYDIEFFSADTDITQEMNTTMNLLVTGVEARHAITSRMRARPYNTTPNEYGTITSPTRVVTTTYFEFVFTSADGSNNGTWTNMEIQHDDGATPSFNNWRDGGCKTDGTSCGVKANGEEFVYTWRYTLS